MTDLPDGFTVEEEDLPEGFAASDDDLPEGFEPAERGFFEQETFTRIGQALDKGVGDVATGIAGGAAQAFRGPEGEKKKPEWIERLRSWGKQFEDPQGESSGIVEDAVVGMATYAAPMIATAINAPIGTGLTFAALYGQKNEELLDRGIDEQVANEAALLHAITSTPAEMAGNLLELGALKRVIKHLGTKAKIGDRLFDIIRAIGTGALGEAGEEGIQAYTEVWADLYAANPNATKEELYKMWDEYTDSEEFKEQRNRAMQTGAVGGALIPGAGVVISGPANAADYFEERKQKVYEKLRATKEQIEEYEAHPDKVKEPKDLDEMFEEEEELQTGERPKQDTVTETGTGKKVAEVVESPSTAEAGITLEQYERQKQVQKTENQVLAAQQSRQAEMNAEMAREARHAGERQASEDRLKRENAQAVLEQAKTEQLDHFINHINESDGNALDAVDDISRQIQEAGESPAKSKGLDKARDLLISDSENIGTLKLARWNIRSLINHADPKVQAVGQRVSGILTDRIDHLEATKIAKEQGKEEGTIAGKKAGKAQVKYEERKRSYKQPVQEDAAEREDLQRKIVQNRPTVSKLQAQAKAAAKKKRTESEKRLAEKAKKRSAEKAKLIGEKLTTRAQVKETYREALQRGRKKRLAEQVEALRQKGKQKLTEEEKLSSKAKMKVADIDSVSSVLTKRDELVRKAKTPAQKQKVIDDFKPLFRRLKKQGKIRYAKSSLSESVVKKVNESVPGLLKYDGTWEGVGEQFTTYKPVGTMKAGQTFIIPQGEDVSIESMNKALDRLQTNHEVKETDRVQVRYAKSSKPAPKLKHKIIQNAVKPLTDIMGSRGLTTKVLRNPSELPKKYSDAKLSKEKGMKTPDGKVFLFSDNLVDTNEAIAIWMHEHIGHEGLKKFCKSNDIDFDQLMLSVHDVVKDLPEYTQMKKIYGPELKNLKPEEARIYLAEEFMAHRAEGLDPVKRKTIWTRIRDFINNWLQRVFKTGRTPELNLKQIDLILEAAKSHYMYGELRQFNEFQRPTNKYVDTVKYMMDKHPKAVTWYQNHQKLVAEKFGDDAGIFNILLALTSPGGRVSTNAKWATETYLYLQGKLDMPRSRFPNMLLSKLNKLTGGKFYTESVKSSQFKVTEFIRALLGDDIATVNDRWMYRIFYGPTKLNNRILQDIADGKMELTEIDAALTKPEAFSARHKMFEIADKLSKEGYNVTPQQVQAALWVHEVQKTEGGREGEVFDYAEGLNTKSAALDGLTPLEYLDKMMGPDKTGTLAKKFNLGKIPKLSDLEQEYREYINKKGKKPFNVKAAPLNPKYFADSNPKSLQLGGIEVSLAEFRGSKTKESILKTRDFAILTAENPQAKALSREENEKRNKRLVEELQDKGYEYVPVEGRYDNLEESFLVFEISNEAALDLAKKYDQESVIHNGDLIYQDGTYNRGDLNNINFSNKLDNYYTSVLIKGKEVKFSIPIDFNNKYMDIIHYSPKGELKEIDPKYMGTGQIGAERHEIKDWETGELYEGFLHKSNWYVPKDAKSIEAHRFGNLPVYLSRVNADEIYEVKEANKPSDVELRKLGYKGWYVPAVGQVRLFESAPVRLLGKSNITKDDFNKVTGANYKNFIEKKFEKTDSQVRYAKSWTEGIKDPKAKAVFEGFGYAQDKPAKSANRLELSFWDRAILWIADDLHALKLLEEGKDISTAMSGYKAHRMLSSFPTMFRQVLEHGVPVYEEHWASNAGDGGLFEAIRKLPEEQREPFFFRYLGKSAQELMAKDRQNLFGENLDDAETVKILLSHTDQIYRENRKVWDEVEKDLERINKGMLDFLEKAGIIDATKRKGWERKYYIPFTRMIEDPSTGEMETIFQRAGGKDIKQVIRKLKGGKSALGDPVQNLVNNYGFMFHEALHNMARKKSLSIMVQAGLAKKEDTKATGNNVLKIYVKGNAQKIRVEDPVLASTLIDLHSVSQGKTSQWLSMPKKWLTWGVTVMPAFRVANFVRDTAHVALIEKSFRPLIDSIKGFKHAIKNDDIMRELAATGGAFSGAYHQRDIGKTGQKALKKLHKDITNKDKFAKAKELWGRFGEASENAARLGLYMRLKESGKSKLEAGYRAKDLLDFYMSGKAAIVQAAIRNIPFLNARIQGLYKVGRTFTDKKTRNNLLLRGAMLTVLAGVVHCWNADDDRYKELQDYERLQYMNFFDVPFGIGHLRIPLPFELGAVFGTLPVFFGQYLNGSVDGKRLFKVVKDTIVDTFRMDVFPQWIKPIAQQYANKNFFTGAPIESLREQGLPAPDRYNERSSDIAKWLGSVVGKHISQVSPKRIDQLVNDILGGFGTAAMYMIDKGIMQWLTSYPEDPATRIGDRYITGIGRFVKGNAAPYRTKSEEEFYEMLRASDEANSAMNNYKKYHQGIKGRLYRQTHRIELSRYKHLRKVQERISRIRARQRLIAESNRSPEKKREEIDRLTEQRNTLLHNVVKRVKGRS